MSRNSLTTHIIHILSTKKSGLEKFSKCVVCVWGESQGLKSFLSVYMCWGGVKNVRKMYEEGGIFLKRIKAYKRERESKIDEFERIYFLNDPLFLHIVSAIVSA